MLTRFLVRGTLWVNNKEVTEMYSLEKNGRRLRELREKVPRQIVASATGISVSALAMYESGERNPRDEVKIALARYYGKQVSDIFFRQEFT